MKVESVDEVQCGVRLTSGFDPVLSGTGGVEG